MSSTSADQQAGESEQRGGATPGLSRPRLAAFRQSFALLDYRWLHRRTQTARQTLQQLLDPGAALLQMAAPLQHLPAAEDLPALNSLHTLDANLLKHLPETPPARSEREAGEPGPSQTDSAGDLSAMQTLDDSVINGLLRALYAALPDALNEPPPETTVSGNVVGRHGYNKRPVQPSLWVPSPAADTAPLDEETPETPEPAAEAPLPPPPEPRPYVVGTLPPDLPAITLLSLKERELSLPAPRTTGLLSAQVRLGQGEACFLRAQSALWSWRTLRQANIDVLAEGPPHLHRNMLMVQRVGPITLLLGYRITDMTEEPRRWGFALGSLTEQVLQSREEFMVEWHEDDEVVFTVEMQQHLAMSNLNFLSPVYSALRRKFRDGYVRNMLELTAE